ncbi:MAG: FHA domain-containing protein [Verrucomicrobia bacterium]|nr:FHA domain-containing protein [Verrucomicrobiota bacterium]
MAEKRKGSPNGLESGSENQGRRLIPDLKKRESIVIGRGVECDVVIKDVKASRKHCRLTRTDGGFVLEDLGSRNGTFVNGEKIEESVTLKQGQNFKAGDTVFYIAR